MKKFIMFIILISCIACNNITTKYVTSENIAVVTIDSCEYLKIVTYGAFYIYSHKGNCSNKIHIYQK